MTKSHTPVMLDEVMKFLAPKKNENFIDCTLGFGGHAQKILEKSSPKGILVAIDQDTENISFAKEKLQKYKNRVIYIPGNFRHLDEIMQNKNIPGISGILFDLGLASSQIESNEKGISFGRNSFLDMRLDPSLKYSAYDVINKYHEKQLANLFFQYGDIKGNRVLARKILEKRQKKPIETTGELVAVIGTNNPKYLAPIFQAIRIEVNHELENLQDALPQAMDVLEPGGRIVVISYHSGEDRIVKNFFRANKSNLNILTKKPIIATQDEIKTNSRARSAKIRAAEKR